MIAMSRFDSLQEFHRLRVLRSLPRYGGVQGFHEGPSISFVIAVVIISVTIGYALGRLFL